ncbi:DUF6634 family protein [Aurantimonas coralicida]|uniref:DUF6634 family protein n=1 Tax=Aurantimonas coralicida TaxID=182270 RepID=UPI001D181030|nr:DUF6634 family protein [Aurantimonas coralicida]MCC4296620.1 hypothetical protein [Aurantimonas coralicida]
MSIIIMPNGTALHIDQELHLLTELQRDIARIAEGTCPTPRYLSDAPVLEHWALGGRMQPCLTGEVYGHPRLRSGTRTITSQLHVFAPNHGYARTLSRFYRLGPPASDG